MELTSSLHDRRRAYRDLDAMEPEADRTVRLLVSDVIDECPISRLQWLTLGLCVFIAALDGFDTQSIGFLAPVMAHSFGIPLARFGGVFTFGLLGLMVGAVTFGSLADRFGRKRMLILSTLAFGVCAFATAFVSSLQSLLLVRFLTGLGLGGAMPNVVALASEFMPRRHSRVCVTLLFCGIPLGAVSGGLISSALLPGYGWQAVFYIGGALPVISAVAVQAWMPESVKSLIARGTDPARVRATMLRIAPDLAGRAVSFGDSEVRYSGATVRHLFTEGRAARTILLWVPYFMNLLVLYFVISWLPSVLLMNGHSVALGIHAVTAFSLGGIIGSLLQGRMMNSSGAAKVLLAEFAIYEALVVSLAIFPLSTAVIIVATFGMGAVVQGAQAGLNSLAAEIYPTPVRATGVGWALGVGRVGSILGPAVGGVMLSAHWSPQHIFLTGLVPGSIAAIAMILTMIRRSND
jgi:MFS transporter, AAHS family, 4-hydroxybenzoate transporter